jgi:eukaryotic-like serine/threonine-protein kinase
MVPSAGQTVSHYRILEKLGQGGMGVVYKAHDTKLDRDVALKFLPAGLTQDPDAKQRFINEARAASALQHENICVIHDIDETDDGQLFICMDYYEGRTLRELIERGLLRVGDAVDVATQVARGLMKAHTQGIVHRDVKPENIIVTGDNTAKIMDFGLAKLKGASGLTRSNSTVGTLFYMSPEQARGLDVDRRSDIFSLGIVLYEMVTGRRPFRGEHEAAIIYSVLNETPEPLSRYAQGISPALEHVVEKALTKDSAQRYQHVDDLLADLKGITPGPRGMTPQRPESALWQRLRRKPLSWMLAGLAAALTVVAGWYLLRVPQRPGDAVPPPAATATEWTNSLAVLPFRDFSSTKDQEYFCNGMTDAIIGRLAKIPELKVMATTSVMRYRNTDKDIREVGRELHVANILEGTLQRERNKIRLSAQLISTESGFHVWADTYDRDASRVFEIQDDISRAIAEALKVRLTAAARATSTASQPQNLEAYEYQLRGMNLVNMYIIHQREEDFQAALTMFNNAIRIEPDYAGAYAGLAWGYQHHIEVTGRVDESAQVVRYSEIAYQKNPHMAEANAAMGWVFHVRGDEDRAFVYLRRSLELDRNSMAINHVIGLFFTSVGLHHQAVKFFQRAGELDPFYLYALSNQAGRWRDVGEFGKAEAAYRKVLELDPQDATYLAAYAYLLIIVRRESLARELLSQAEGRRPADPTLRLTLPVLYAVEGNKAKALAAMQHPDAVVYSILGMTDEAIATIEKNHREVRDYSYLPLITNPLYDPLRADRRFREIINCRKQVYDDLVRKFGGL